MRSSGHHLAASEAKGALLSWQVLTIEVPSFEVDGFRWRGSQGVGFVSWEFVQRAFAAEVGEPEGVRAVVFDLVVGAPDRPTRLFRFCRDPHDGAVSLARSLVSAVGGRCSKRLRDFAREGQLGLSVPDLAALDEVVSAALATPLSLDEL